MEGGVMEEVAQAVKHRIARNVIARRKALGATQEMIAHKAGMACRHFQKLEAGELNVTITTLVRVAHALGVDVRDLIEGDEQR